MIARMKLRSRFAYVFAGFLIFASPSVSSPVPYEQIHSAMILHEGIRCVPYKIGGEWHAGIGHKLDPSVPRPSAYTNDAIYDWFDSDLKNARRICQKGIKRFDELPWDAQIVCISLAWNVGPSGFMRFTDFRLQMSKKKYARAIEALKKSRWWGQVGENRKSDMRERLKSLE